MPECRRAASRLCPIASEAELDRQFAGRTVTPETLKAMTAQIASTQGQLRETHLKYHLSTVAVLSPHQITQYAQLRGYAGNGPTGHQYRQH